MKSVATRSTGVNALRSPDLKPPVAVATDSPALPDPTTLHWFRRSSTVFVRWWVRHFASSRRVSETRYLSLDRAQTQVSKGSPTPGLCCHLYWIIVSPWIWTLASTHPSSSNLLRNHEVALRLKVADFRSGT